MRLIDADVFEVVTWTGIPEGYNDTFGDGVDWILEKIDRQPTIGPEYYDYSDIDDVWEYYAEEQDIRLTDNGKKLKDAMWVGYRKGKQDAQPEREKGKWIHERLASTTGGSYPVVRCSICQNTMPFEWETHYCPNCGANMRGEPYGAD